MKAIDLILKCYGKDKLDEDFTIEGNGILYTSWMIQDIETKKELLKIFTKKQIFQIYISGIWMIFQVEILWIFTFFEFIDEKN